MKPSSSLAALDEAGVNNFDIIRIVAASLVFFSHVYPISGFAGGEPLTAQTAFISFGTLAVEIFFVVSGYLVTRSLILRDNLIDFAEARALRIFPALIVCCLFSALVIGPLISTYSAIEYFRNAQVWLYAWGNSSLTSLQWFLPGVFESNPLRGVVNLSLWTLPTEFKMYGAVFALGVCTILLKRFRAPLIALAFASYLVHMFATNSSVLANHLVSDPEPLIAFFLFGGLVYLCRQFLFISPTIALLLWAALLLSRGGPLASLLYYVALTYSVVVIAFDQSIRLPQLTRHGDPSYGLYLYGFPVTQTAMFFLGTPSTDTLVVVAFPVTLILAVVSWRYVEAPAIAAKGFTSRHLRTIFPNKSTKLE